LTSAEASKDRHGPGGRQTAGVSNGDTKMKIKLTSIYVDDQEKALGFYTGVLGLTK
jgi:hypothetical protein